MTVYILMISIMFLSAVQHRNAVLSWNGVCSAMLFALRDAVDNCFFLARRFEMLRYLSSVRHRSINDYFSDVTTKLVRRTLHYPHFDYIIGQMRPYFLSAIVNVKGNISNFFELFFLVWQLSLIFR